MGGKELKTRTTTFVCLVKTVTFAATPAVLAGLAGFDANCLRNVSLPVEKHRCSIYFLIEFRTVF